MKTILMRMVWVTVCKIFEISNINAFKSIDPKIVCEFIPITSDNCQRVRDFREESRVANYRNKLDQKEIGFFAQHNGKMIGSIWATVNSSKEPKVVRTFIDLMHQEGLIHDIVVSEKFRGLSVGPFIISKMATLLFKEYGVGNIVVDVNIKNRSSLRMMSKSGLRLDRMMFFVSVLGKRVINVELKKYSS